MRKTDATSRSQGLMLVRGRQLRAKEAACAKARNPDRPRYDIGRRSGESRLRGE